VRASAGTALVAEALGLCYAVYKGEKMQAILFGASMVTTYFATREKARIEANHERRMQTLEGYIAELRGIR
jgi:hypothetical protein